MKNTLKFPTLLGCLALLLSTCQSSKKFTTGNEKSLAEILEDYSKNQSGVGFTIVTNQPSSEVGFITVPNHPSNKVIYTGPPATWTLGYLKKVPPSNPTKPDDLTIGGFVLRSPATGINRYWSTRQYPDDGVFHPFDPAQTDRVMLEIRVAGNGAVQANLFKEESNGTVTTFSVEIYGYLTGAQGHLIYGRYGGFNGLITISLWKALPVAG